MENGYRNVLATIGITRDGALRNIVGQEGEAAVKARLLKWLKDHKEIETRTEGNITFLGPGDRLQMVFSSEPDISFRQMTDAGEWEIVSTIEIKSGADPAGALERLGAIQKSFDATPVKSRNFAVLGVVTQEMRRRLNDLNFEKDFSLYQILNDEEAWEDFVQELFHYTLRVI